MRLILISGLSGSGKSIALHTLEDVGYCCVDNLPVNLLSDIMMLYKNLHHQHIAISIDARSDPSFKQLATKMHQLLEGGIDVQLIFLDARNEILVQRFSETRRTHPLTHSTQTIGEAIHHERMLMAQISELGHKIDTSTLSIHALQQLVLQFSQQESPLTLICESFGFKYGVPLDADFIFDVRCLPSPHHQKALRPLTGLDQPIINYFLATPMVAEMIDDIKQHINKWLPRFIDQTRRYLTIAIGCTGGQHRSVYIAEQLSRQLYSNNHTLVRHRQLLPPS